MDKVTSFELPADNMKRAQKFFEDVFDWEFETWEKNDYAHIKTVEMDKNWVPKEKGAINGGLFKRMKKTDKPLVVVEVDSIDDTLAKVTKAKGKVVTEKQPVEEWGFWAEIMDTEGNIMELWEEKE